MWIKFPPSDNIFHCIKLKYKKVIQLSIQGIQAFGRSWDTHLVGMLWITGTGRLEHLLFTIDWAQNLATFLYHLNRKLGSSVQVDCNRNIFVSYLCPLCLLWAKRTFLINTVIRWLLKTVIIQKLFGVIDIPCRENIWTFKSWTLQLASYARSQRGHKEFLSSQESTHIKNKLSSWSGWKLVPHIL